MKRPLLLDIRPEGKLNDKMVMFDKKLRTGFRHEELRNTKVNRMSSVRAKSQHEGKKRMTKGSSQGGFFENLFNEVFGCFKDS